MSFSTLPHWARPTRLQDVRPELTPHISAARSESATPWFVQIPAVLAMMVAAALCCAGLWDWMDSDVVRLQLGVTLAMASIGVSWTPIPGFGRTLTLFGALFARGLVFFGTDRSFEALLALDAVLLLLHRNRADRVLAAIGLLWWPCWMIRGHTWDTIAVTAFAVLAGSLLVASRQRWLLAPAWVREPLAAMTIGWLGFALVVTGWLTDDGVWLNFGLGAAATGLAAAIAVQARTSAKTTLLAAATPAVLAALTIPVPAVFVCTLVAFGGYLAGSRWLWGAAVIAMAAHAVHFYYDLDWTLAPKGGAMVGTGLLLMGAGALAGRFRRRGTRAPAERWRGSPRHLVLAGGVAFALLTMTAGVVERETQLAISETAYLPLAPRDPRSLTQGDYMRLRYAIDRELWAQEVLDSDAVVVARDGTGTLSFVRADDGRPLDPDERRLELTHSRGGSKASVVPNAYLFQEGKASEYAAARFGIVALSPGGRASLIGLADENLARLGPPPSRF